MSVVYYNSEYIKRQNFAIGDTDRSFNYGDGFFESIRIINGRVFNLDLHLERIAFASKILAFTAFENEDSLSIVLDKLIQLNKLNNASAKVKISRSGAGQYLPSATGLNILVTTTDLATVFVQNTPINLCAYKEQIKAKSSLSNIKSSNALVSVLGAIFAKTKNVDNALLFNSNDAVIETTNSNLFIVKQGLISTPCISEGCVAGTMRKLILQLDKNIQQKSISIKEIMEADEIFTTNAISGITPVKTLIYNNNIRNFTIKKAPALQEKLISLSLDL